MADEKRNLTEQQQLFLNYLASFKTGDIREAMTAAGYSENTSPYYVIKPLRKEIIEIAEILLATHSVKGVLALVDSVDNPSKPSTNNKINAANSLLDRAGLGKKSDDNKGTVVNADKVFILPAKEAST